MRRRLAAILVVAATAATALSGGSSASQALTTRVTLPGLDGPVRVVRDSIGVPHVFAKTDHDAYYMVGYLHAQDRLFQMDVSRRQASGTLAELLGSGALASDVQLRTIGLRRAAQRSLAALSPQAEAVLTAYAAGVNAWVSSHPLPSEYAALELTTFAPWTALDSVTVVKLLAFGLSFDLGDITRTQLLLTYQGVGSALGFDGTKLFFEDVMRSEPFSHAPSIMPGETSGQLASPGPPALSSSHLAAATLGQAKEALADARKARIPTEPTDQGSNVWVVSGARSASGRPMVASDPHLSLSSPSVFYEVGLDVTPGRDQKALSLYGVTFPGTPLVVHGMNEHVAWGSTVNPTDVTDVYQERVVLAGAVPVATLYKGNPEPTQIIQEVFRANQPGNGTPNDLVVASTGATVVVPRRNNGPLITSPSGSPPTALSVQFTGFSATREPDMFLEIARARTVDDFKRALRYFDFGAQNWMVVDDSGNIGYFTSGEIPLREDLEAGAPAGLPPFFIRDGTGTLRNEWIPDTTQAEDQALPYEILPFAEMDQLVDPPRGWISNANQDPNGQTFDNDPLNELRPSGGIRYITSGHSDGNRNARITARIQQALANDGKVSFEEMQSIQADVALRDAEVLVPYVVNALQAARTPGAPAALAALGEDPAVQQAVGRLASWDFTTSTGIDEGFDAADVNGLRGTPTQAEVDASVAATIWALTRSRLLASFIDGPLALRGLGGALPPGDQAMTALRHLLETGGVGVSGIDFFDIPALPLPSVVERDVKILQSIRDALDKLKGADFAAAFGLSTTQSDYRWGRLHRITFGHVLGPAFSIPVAGGFANLAPSLPGIATDGGFSTVDASSHNPRASTLNGFTFGSGPARRFVAEARRSQPEAVQVIPGGESGNPAGPSFANQLGLWLTDDYHPATVQVGEIERDAASLEEFAPPP
jgi:penicillin amidase